MINFGHMDKRKNNDDGIFWITLLFMLYLRMIEILAKMEIIETEIHLKWKWKFFKVSY